MDQSYPVQVRARLDEPLSRWLWLVKWLLAIPHYVVLFFLWIAFAVVTVIAFSRSCHPHAIPTRLFSFNLGVLRWSWRITSRAYIGLGFDRYRISAWLIRPATLDVAYLQRLSQGLVLVGGGSSDPASRHRGRLRQQHHLRRDQGSGEHGQAISFPAA